MAGWARGDGPGAGWTPPIVPGPRPQTGHWTIQTILASGWLQFGFWLCNYATTPSKDFKGGTNPLLRSVKYHYFHRLREGFARQACLVLPRHSGVRVETVVPEHVVDNLLGDGLAGGGVQRGL